MTTTSPDFPFLHTETKGPDAWLNCPLCGSPSGLHIDTVQILTASGQNLLATAHGEDSNATIDVALKTGPESARRRHRVVLTSWCEICGMKADISFEQHKGQTLVNISDQGPRD